MHRPPRRYGRLVREAHALILVLALAACGKADNDPGPGSVTVGEARALDEAAQMIESRQPPPELLQPSRTQWPSDAPQDEAPQDHATAAAEL